MRRLTVNQLLNRAFLGGAFFLQALIIAMAYTVTQDQRGLKSNFFFFTVPAQTVPYCMLIGSVLMNPGVVMQQITGIIAAHLHDFLYRLWPEFGGGPNILATPSLVSYLVQTPMVFQRHYGTAVRPTDAAGSSTGASEGSVLPDSWKTRGAGHRLG
jgi:Derlin-2/3